MEQAETQAVATPDELLLLHEGRQEAAARAVREMAHVLQQRGLLTDDMKKTAEAALDPNDAQRVGYFIGMPRSHDPKEVAVMVGESTCLALCMRTGGDTGHGIEQRPLDIQYAVHRKLIAYGLADFDGTVTALGREVAKIFAEWSNVELEQRKAEYGLPGYQIMAVPENSDGAGKSLSECFAENFDATAAVVSRMIQAECIEVGELTLMEIQDRLERVACIFMDCAHDAMDCDFEESGETA